MDKKRVNLNFLKFLQKMDLLSALPVEIFSEVAKNFNAKDILRASMVSKRWYQMFGQSRECMKKIVLKYTKYNCKSDANILMRSHRSYQNIIIEFGLSRIKESGGEINVRAILNKFSRTLVTLETSHDFQRICELPRLEELEFKNHAFYSTSRLANHFCRTGLLTKCLNLKKLDIRFGDLTSNSKRVIAESLKELQKLKILTIKNLDVIEQLQETNYKFRLEEIDIAGYRQSFGHKIDSIQEFLRVHQQSLKVVRIDKVRLDYLAILLSEFPIMHTLHIRDISRSPKDQENVYIPKNTSIKKIIISCAVSSPEVRQKISDMLVHCLNLKELKIHLLHVRFINTLPSCQLLTKVEFCFLSRYTPAELHSYIGNSKRIEFVAKPFSCS